MSVNSVIRVFLAFFLVAGLWHGTANAGKKQFRPLVRDHIAINGKKSYFPRKKPYRRVAQSSGPRIPPSAALRAAMRVAPGSKGLGVRYVRARNGYVVTLKTRGRIRRVFVDARSGRVSR